jgi:acetamidase/formamidase
MHPEPFLSPQFHYTFGPHSPVRTVRPGESIRVVCPDSDNELSDGSVLTADQRQVSPGGLLFEGNPMAGPFFIEGAHPGDTVTIKIDGIELDRQKGQTGLAYAHGVLPAHLLMKDAQLVREIPRHLYEWAIDTATGYATLVNALGDQQIKIRLDPMVGSIGVCPLWGQSLSTLEKGVFGGNMDLPLTKPGTTVYLPVNCEGALLFMGDIHAAQGHGEIIGGGIETSGIISCTIGLLKNATISSPRFIDSQHLSATGLAGDLLTAIQAAYAHLLDWIVSDYHLNRWDAYNLISQTGSIVIGGLGDAPHIVAAQIPLHAIQM